MLASLLFWSIFYPSTSNAGTESISFKEPQATVSPTLTELFPNYKQLQSLSIYSVYCIVSLRGATRVLPPEPAHALHRIWYSTVGLLNLCLCLVHVELLLHPHRLYLRVYCSCFLPLFWEGVPIKVHAFLPFLCTLMYQQRYQQRVLHSAVLI